MANEEPEDDNFFGTEFPLLEPDNIACVSNTAGEPPPNAGRLPSAANSQRPPKLSHILPRVSSRPPTQVVLPYTSQSRSTLEERPLSIPSASTHTDDPESDHSHPRPTSFPARSLQLPIRPRPPLPPRRKLRLDLETRAPPIGPRDEAHRGFRPGTNLVWSAGAQDFIDNSPAGRYPPDIRKLHANGQARSTSESSQGSSHTGREIPIADIADQGSPLGNASGASFPDQGASHDDGHGSTECLPCDDSTQTPEESSDHIPGHSESLSLNNSLEEESFASLGSDGPFRVESSSMPYNNAAIPPPDDISGQASLPLARVKKILQVDEDTVKVSNNAAFVITIATEMFIRHLAEQAMNVAKLDKKPRRNIQYKDLANAVARIDNLQFLEDVIPRTTSYREYKTKRANKAPIHLAQSLQNGQTTLDGARSLPQRPVAMADTARAAVDDGNMSDGTIDEPSIAQIQPAKVNGNAGLVFEHYEPNGTTRRDESGDVDMG